MALKINKLKEGRAILSNPPTSQSQRAYAFSIGYREKGPGLWVLRERRPPLTLKMIEEHGPGHLCKACKTFFCSTKQRDQYCLSCRIIIEGIAMRLAAKIAAVSSGIDALSLIDEELVCTYPVSSKLNCEWKRNEKRMVPKGLHQLSDYIPGWAEKAHCHHMRHIFFNRFPYSKRFFPALKSKEESEESRRYYYENDRLFNEVRVEIDYPDEAE